MKAQMQKLLMCRVKPYYIYQCDLIAGSAHLRASVRKGLQIMEQLRGHTTGYAVPTYVIDAPGGGGKVPVSPEYVLSRNADRVRHPQLRRQNLRISRKPPTARRCSRAPVELRSRNWFSRSLEGGCLRACLKILDKKGSVRVSRAFRGVTPRNPGARNPNKALVLGNSRPPCGRRDADHSTPEARAPHFSNTL